MFQLYRLYFTNFPERGLVDSYDTLTEAREAGAAYGFEYHVMCNGQLVGAWNGWGWVSDLPIPKGRNEAKDVEGIPSRPWSTWRRDNRGV